MIYTLFYNGYVVGWAAFHRKEVNYIVNVDVKVNMDKVVRAKSEYDAIRKATEELALDGFGVSEVHGAVRETELSE